MINNSFKIRFCLFIELFSTEYFLDAFIESIKVGSWLNTANLPFSFHFKLIPNALSFALNCSTQVKLLQIIDESHSYYKSLILCLEKVAVCF